MCNLFYPDKSEERADYIHYRLHTGRIMRKARLLLVVRREKEKQAKMLRFSPRRKLVHFLCGCFRVFRRTFICPGCEWKSRVSKGCKVSFTAGGREVKDQLICHNCFLDYEL